MELDIVGGTPVSVEEFERTVSPIANQVGDTVGSAASSVGNRISNAVGPIAYGGEADIRGLGLGARSALQGLGGLVGTFGGDAFNAYVAAPIESAITGREVQPQSYRNLASGLADRIGLPQPENTRERVLGGVGEFLTGAGATLGAGSAASGTAVGNALLPMTLRGNIAQGAAIGALQPTDTGAQQGVNALAGAAFGGAGYGIGNALRSFTPEAGSAMGQARRIGLNLTDEPGAQVQQLAGAARNLAPDTRGDALLDVQQGVRDARE